MAKVYGAYNRSKRQRYYGKTTRKVDRRLSEHEAGNTKALKNWNWGKDKITTRTIAKGLAEKAAIKKAHELEQRKPPRGWKTIQTGGP